MVTQNRVSIVGDGKLSDHLTKAEVRAKSTGTLKNIDANLPGIFEIVRKYAGGLPAKINSAIRNFTPAGGVDKSAHRKGDAFDIGLTAAQMATLYKNRQDFIRDAVTAGLQGLGVYSWGVHVDTGNGPVKYYYAASSDASSDNPFRFWQDRSGPKWFVQTGSYSPATYSDDGTFSINDDVELNADKNAHGFPWWLLLLLLPVLYFTFKNRN